MQLLTRPLTALGNAVLDIVEFLGGLGFLISDAVFAVRRALFSKRGRRLGWHNLWAQMVRVGVNSIPIVCLVVFCIGAILALQMAPVLRDYGVVERTADVIGVAMFRELG